MDRLALELGADPADPWAAFRPSTAAARLCAERRATLWPDGLHRQTREDPGVPLPDELPIRIASRTDTQRVFGDSLAALARSGDLVDRLVTASPDVSVSTNLGGCITRVGVYARAAGPATEYEGTALLTWRPGPGGRHIELGISETNLFMLLGQLGLTAELLGEPLVPIGTVYDPFICRGLDALVYGLYAGARFVVVGTPSGISLAPEGGAHQALITPSIGIELPGLRAYEPAFGHEVAWALLEAVRGVLAGAGGFSTYLRLSTRPVDQSLAEPVARRLGMAEWRRQVLAGGYRLLEARDADPPLPPESPRVTIAAAGVVVTEAVAATRALHAEEIAADLVVVTSAERLSAEIAGSSRLAAGARRDAWIGHVSSLIGPRGDAPPLVTVLDGASHTLAFLGAAAGVPVIPLGVDDFGQSGTIPDLYRAAGIDADHIVDAALLALELTGQL